MNEYEKSSINKFIYSTLTLFRIASCEGANSFAQQLFGTPAELSKSVVHYFIPFGKSSLKRNRSLEQPDSSRLLRIGDGDLFVGVVEIGTKILFFPTI